MPLQNAALLFFFVISPLGIVPAILAALKDIDPARHKRIIVRECLIALAILLVFLGFGRGMLNMLNISIPAMTAAGGVMLMLIALRLIFPTDEKNMRVTMTSEPFVVPIAIPYIAGPSILATEILMISQEPERWPVWLGAILIAWVATLIILYLGADLRRLLGDRGLMAIERLMGMILVLIATQMLLSGVVETLKDAGF
jgi:small neutral amino acid transporter SnatA (MarC family)